ncbi:MAG: ATP-dependent DNA helicase [bacterium]|nr:ATP-dependent DNA helicase [bacterium]
MADTLKLNPQQKEAIEHGKGPLLIIAGAGTGKTTVVTERIKHLILKDFAKPQEVLALTFTEKASREMEERVDIAMPYGYTQMWISTFHSFCDRVLRDEALQIGLDPRYRLMTEAETIRFMREHLFDFELNYFRPLGNPTKFLAGMLQHFSRLKDEDVSPTDYIQWAQAKSDKQSLPLRGKRKAKSSEKHDIEKWQELAGAYRTYEELKTKEGAMDFADLISNTLKLFRTRTNVLGEYQKKFKYVLVDEFQDTNIAQNELIKLLAGQKANLTVVADDDQSIYKWRGAAVSNVIQFRKTYPKAKIVTLTQNYRSTQTILDHAYKLIQNNNPDRLEVKEKIDKKLTSVRKIEGETPQFVHADRVENEADSVAKRILSIIEGEKKEFSDFAILVRANNHAEPFVRALARVGIPYQFLGPGQLFRQPEVKELIAYLKVLYNFEDSQAFYKVLTMEHFGILARDLAAITNYAKKFNLSLFEAADPTSRALRGAGELFLSDEGKRKVGKLIEMIHKHLKLLPRETAGQIAYYFLEDSGILKSMVSPQNAQDEKRSQNISRFFDKLKTYEVEHEDASIFVVVDWIDLSMELGESPRASDTDWTRENAVNILTVHSSKGLEFPVVFLVNLVGDRFPTRERREQIPIPDELIKEILPEGDYHLQEERRLFYVGATRAMDRLYLAAADYYGEGKRERKISPFVVEMLGEIANRKSQIAESEQLSILDYQPSPISAKLPTSKLSLPITYLSYSQINTFQFCPMHYKLKYILRIPTSPSAAQSFGTSLHSVLKDFNDLLMRGHPTSLKLRGARKLILELYEKNWIKLGYSSKSHEEKTKKQGERYLLEYLKTNLFDPRNLPLALEQSFIFPLTSGLKIGGVIDRVDKTKAGIEIIDYKTTDFTTKDMPSEKELMEDLQLSVYGMAANKVNHPLFGKSPEEVTLSLYFFNKGKKVSTTRTAEQLEKAAEEILKVKEEMEASDFQCSGNFWCKDCEYKLFCLA